jgi:[NiFe] hydrogenase diaphorase moiety large subunit
MVFGPQRDLLDIVRQFAEFFAEEACGWCVPCRVGTTVLVQLLDKVLHNRGTLKDVQQLESLSRTVGRTSRCGLGQTAPNPILSTLRNFPHLWEARTRRTDFIPVFDLEQSLRTAIAVQGRLPVAEDLA